MGHAELTIQATCDFIRSDEEIGLNESFYFGERCAVEREFLKELRVERRAKVAR